MSLHAEALRLIIGAIVRDELRALGVSVKKYRRGALPPGFKSDEAYAAECRKLFGKSSPFKIGRSWVVPADAWHAARAKSRPPTTTDEALADQLLSQRNRFTSHH